MSVLLVVEHQHGQLASNVGSALAAIRKLGEHVTVLVAGANATPVATAVANLNGVTEVLLCTATSPDSAVMVAEDEAQLIASHATGHSHVLMADSTHCKKILPRAAALANSQMLTGVTDIESADTFTRPIYSGNLMVTCVNSDPIKFLSIRATTFTTDVATTTTVAAITEIDPPAPCNLSVWHDLQVTESTRPELTSADVVVAGGRGLGGKEGFTLLEQLADRINAAVGSTRAAVDAGDAPNEWQVGQTGKVIAPKLYIAVGISGAMQHIAGMKDAEVIVAINKDREAPIMAIADYCLIGDAQQIIRDLIAAIDAQD